MSVDCRIYLPGNVRVRDVAKVIGRLMGCEAKKEPLGSSYHPDAWSVNVSGVSVKAGCVEGMADIFIKSKQAKAGESQLSWFYHFEADTFPGMRVMLPGSRPLSKAIGKRLVEFFGGKVDYSDCDEKDIDYQRPAKKDSENCPNDGKPWQRLQQRIFDVKPLTEEEIAKFN